MVLMYRHFTPFLYFFTPFSYGFFRLFVIHAHCGCELYALIGLIITVVCHNHGRDQEKQEMAVKTRKNPYEKGVKKYEKGVK